MDRWTTLARTATVEALQRQANAGDVAAIRLLLERRHPDYHPDANTAPDEITDAITNEEAAAELPFEYL